MTKLLIMSIVVNTINRVKQTQFIEVTFRKQPKPILAIKFADMAPIAGKFDPKLTTATAALCQRLTSLTRHVNWSLSR